MKKALLIGLCIGLLLMIGCDNQSKEGHFCYERGFEDYATIKASYRWKCGDADIMCFNFKGEKVFDGEGFYFEEKAKYKCYYLEEGFYFEEKAKYKCYYLEEDN